MRLDNFLHQKGYFLSRNKAQESINRGEIFIDGRQATKPSLDVACDFLGEITIKATSSFVSLGGFKIEKALKDFSFSVNDLIVADIGASTGGFTDCLLQNGAKKVYAVDISDNLLNENLANDKRVIKQIKNARELTKNDFNDRLDLITADLSFISLSHVLPVFNQILDSNSHILVLIKPQFETGKRQKFKNGIIRDEKIHRTVLENILLDCVKNNFIPLNLTQAPRSEDKNLEFMLLCKKDTNNNCQVDINKLIIL